MSTTVKHTIVRPFFIVWWMDLIKADGLTTPWDVIYYRNAKSYSNGRLRKHELMHIEQMEREGKPLFLLKYNWYWITRGYWNNPYEIEAREAEDK